MSDLKTLHVNQSINYDTTGNNRAGICNSRMVGVIELFNSTNIPINYLICDGTQISSSTNSEYSNLIHILSGDTSATTAYLPDFSSEIFPLGWSTSSNSNLGNYNTSGSVNSTGNSSLDINYFPSHKHTINTKKSSIDVKPTEDNSKYAVTIVYDDPPDEAGFNDTKSHDQGKNNEHKLVKEHKHEFKDNKYNMDVSLTLDTNYNIKYDWNTELSNNNNSKTVKYIPESCYLVFAIRYK